MRSVFVAVLLLLNAAMAVAQTAIIRVEVRGDEGPVRDADVVVNGARQQTDAYGVSVFRVPPGMPRKSWS